MEHESVADVVLEAVGVASSPLVEQVLDLLHESVVDLESLSHDDIVRLVAAAVSGSAGAVVRCHLQQRAGASTSHAEWRAHRES